MNNNQVSHELTKLFTQEEFAKLYEFFEFTADQYEHMLQSDSMKEIFAYANTYKTIKSTLQEEGIDITPEMLEVNVDGRQISTEEIDATLVKLESLKETSKFINSVKNKFGAIHDFHKTNKW